ncbi:MAG: sporulation protein YunB [Sarcina sp.]
MYQRVAVKKYSIGYRIKFYLILIVTSLSLLFLSFIYYFDNIIAPTVMTVADAEMRAKTTDIINKNINEIYGENFNYEDMIKVEKDNNGKIVMLTADTTKLNSLATELVLESQQEIKDVGAVGVRIPIGYITKNNIMSYWGPKITVKMEPIGRIETSYSSTFEGAGFNQTRHLITINLKTKLKIILPLQSDEVEVNHQIPISDRVIVGEVPRTSFGTDLFENDEGNKNVEENKNNEN